MFGSLGFGEILLIAVVALIVIGPEKLPEVLRSVGKGLAEFRRTTNELRWQIMSSVDPVEPPTPKKAPPAPKPRPAVAEAPPSGVALASLHTPPDPDALDGEAPPSEDAAPAEAPPQSAAPAPAAAEGPPLPRRTPTLRPAQGTISQDFDLSAEDPAPTRRPAPGAAPLSSDALPPPGAPALGPTEGDA